MLGLPFDGSTRLSAEAILIITWRAGSGHYRPPSRGQGNSFYACKLPPGRNRIMSFYIDTNTFLHF